MPEINEQLLCQTFKKKKYKTLFLTILYQYIFKYLNNKKKETNFSYIICQKLTFIDTIRDLEV